jgi:hypothetical protein
MCRALRLLAGLLLVVPLAGALAADPETEGLRAFAAERFDEAAVGLKQSVRERTAAAQASGQKPTVSGQTAYVLGRSFQELGLRGLALHYLAQAELYGTPAWRLLARRELAHVYFEAADYPAVMQVVDRMGSEEADPEISYYAGLAAAEVRAWPQSIEMLGRVAPSSGYHGYALYARAQARAASGDLAGALADLDEVIARTKAEPERRKMLLLFSTTSGRPEALLEQARVLRGKILYLDGRDADARASFASVSGRGAAGFEAVRGMLLTGAGVESAAKIEISPSRPVDAAALLTVKAVAAEQGGDYETARRIREQVRDLVKQRLSALDRLGTDPAAEADLERDLAAFWQRLRRARWRQRWEEEQPALSREMASVVGSPAAAADEAFVPKDGIFYGVWDQSRLNAWLHGLVELRAFTEQLDADITAAPKRRSFWQFWRADDDLRLADGLLVIRVANVRQRLADHLHNFSALAAAGYAGRKRQAVERSVKLLDRLYLGPDRKIPERLINLQTALEYKRYDLYRLVDSVPERATDPVISLFGNYVDLLADVRVWLANEGQDLPKASAESAALLEALRADNRELTTEISSYIAKAVEPTRRAQVAFFTRIEADNEGSLSRLYGRVGARRSQAETREGEAAPGAADRESGGGSEGAKP